MTTVEIDWSGVRVLAIAVGVREAARRLGISEEATMKRCQREGWLATPETRHVAARSVQERAPSALSAAVRTPAQAMALELGELGGKSRISIARGLHAGAKEIEQMTGTAVLANASDIKSTVQSLATVHGWSNSAPVAKIALTVTGAHAVEIEQPTTHEVEWSDVTQQSDDVDLTQF